MAVENGCQARPQVYSLRPATAQDLEPMMAIGHEGIRPHVEAVREWIPETEEQGFRDHFTPELIKIIVVDGEDAGYLKVENHDDHVFLDDI
jgi:hypothetical protein